VVNDQVERVSLGQPGSPEKFELPKDFGMDYYYAGYSRPVLFDGSLYLLGGTRYRLPDDRREVQRPVVVRLNAGRKEVVARCVPAPPFDPNLPQGGQDDIEGVDINASESGVFVLRRRSTTFSPNRANERFYPYAVKVFP
jgi:hypothetical protein